MSDFTATLEEFEAVFGPATRSTGSGDWDADEFEFHVVVADAALTFRVVPSLGDVWVSFNISGREIYELESQGVQDVQVHTHPGGSFIEIAVAESDSVAVVVQPELYIRHNSNGA